jgi:hypothetical protein
MPPLSMLYQILHLNILIVVIKINSEETVNLEVRLSPRIEEEFSEVRLPNDRLDFRF